MQKSLIFALFIDLEIFPKSHALALKSLGVTSVSVQVRSAAPRKEISHQWCLFLYVNRIPERTHSLNVSKQKIISGESSVKKQNFNDTSREDISACNFYSLQRLSIVMQ